MLYAPHGGASGDTAMVVRNKNAEMKATEQAEKDDMAEADANKRAYDLGLVTVAAMDHLGQVVLGGRVVVLEQIMMKHVRYIIIINDPDGPAPRGGKAKLLARFLTYLPMVVKVQ
jgi:hypothetical protein